MSDSNRQGNVFAAALHHVAQTDKDHWSYKRMGKRPGLHGLIRYPAMMVPQMQADVLGAALAVRPDIRRVVDPFVGSGTTMLEVLKRGLSFEGVDINPLAILICRAKLLSINPRILAQRIHKLLAQISADRGKSVDVDFVGRDKWFTPTACIQLSRVRRHIVGQRGLAFRQFLWVILAESIRQTSLSRETTYKLHIRPPSDRDNLEGPQPCFHRLALEAIERYAHQWEQKFVPRDESMQNVHLLCGDIRRTLAPGGSSQLLLTSPPYGDNQTTIPYGQFSYLALRWISERDLEGEPRLRDSAYAIDTASLGGSSRGYIDRALSMAAVSSSFKSFFDRLARQRRPDLEAKAACFTADLFEAIGAALDRLEKDGIAIWTLGERRIGGLPVPLVQICTELNEFFGMERLTSVSRHICSKRIPHRNSQGATMVRETMLVMCKS